ncbi:MAG: orotate phosphoribosyltransferase [Nannocystaceae bacterium]|nr:orotate phosphoribosyltransferase [Nannocystaceae bacterium]
MEPYQRDFVDLLVRFEVLRFGEFTLKSGRTSPYFVNAGQFRTGAAIAALGHAFAQRMIAAELANTTDIVFGPSYKGVPLAVATAAALAERGTDIGYAFDRKEAKDHGEGGVFVGSAPTDGSRVVIVDDVITSGRSIREAAALLRSAGKVEIMGVVVAVDRQERGRGDATTLSELQDELGVPVLPVLSITDIVTDLAERGALPADRRDAVMAHVAEFGAR